ncbi:Uncharacterised protein [Mycobacterium tuberculosis]|nr:Uncharacterised protein [Mycobacterium tuberculosis]
MIVGKIPIECGYVTRIENGRIYVSRGEISDVYNAEYYRIPADTEEWLEREENERIQAHVIWTTQKNVVDET